MDQNAEKRLTQGALKAATKEVATFKKALQVQEELEFCAAPYANYHERDVSYARQLTNDPALAQKNGEAAVARQAARQELDAKIGAYLKKQGLDITPTTNRTDTHQGADLLNTIINQIEAQTVAKANNEFANGRKPKGCER